jgi:hypothetical protein
MTLAVVGLGLVSPAGRTPREHAFFLRARAAAPPRSPFVLAEGATLDVRFCPWLGARASLASRLAHLAEDALGGALGAVTDPTVAARALLLACTAEARPGFTEAARDAVCALAQRQSGATSMQRFIGAAGTFAALERAEGALQGGECRAVIVLAVDSYVTLDALTWDVTHPPGPWAGPRWPRSEGAAAFLLMRDDTARRAGLEVLGVIEGAASRRGASNDDNDEIVDGVAMTDVLRALPSRGPVRLALGQTMLDGLRRREWFAAVARLATQFDVECAHRGIEDDTGDVGAAAGAMNVALALATGQHDTGETPGIADPGVLAWAISRDGTRGAARVGRGP